MTLCKYLKPNRGESIKDPNCIVAQNLAKLFEYCPLCTFGFSGHDYARLATCIVPLSKYDTLWRFFEVTRNHQWEELREFQNRISKADDLEAFAIRCSGRLTVAIINSHFEHLQPNLLIYSEALSLEESGSLLETFPDLRWYPSRA